MNSIRESVLKNCQELIYTPDEFFKKTIDITLNTNESKYNNKIAKSYIEEIIIHDKKNNLALVPNQTRSTLIDLKSSKIQ